jgi:hypothetical protein
VTASAGAVKLSTVKEAIIAAFMFLVKSIESYKIYIFSNMIFYADFQKNSSINWAKSWKQLPAH